MRNPILTGLIIFCILFFAFSRVSKAQSYIPMLNDSLYWDVAFMDNLSVNSLCLNYGDFYPKRYFLSHDTLINAISYKVLGYYTFIPTNSQGINCPPYLADTIALSSNIYIREDTILKKVYRYDPWTVMDYLLFDYNAQIGDTIFYTYPGSLHTTFVVDTIYSIITPDGVSRLKFEDIAPNAFGGYYIEGLGGVEGPFETPFNLFEVGPWVMCIGDAYQNSIISNAGCYGFVTGLPYIEESTEVMIQPNPCIGTLEIKNLQLNQQLIISDLAGKFINAIFYVGQPIDVSMLQSGLYFINMKNNNQLVAIGKFIKQ